MNFLKNQFRLSMFFLQHEKMSDFYLSPCQSSTCPVPLLILRPFLFVTAIAITFYSKGSYIRSGHYNVWFIYLTHWGLMTVIFTTAFAMVVSLKATLSHGAIGDKAGLAWYVKIYWVLYNIAKPFAILITIFFWAVLYERGDKIPLALCGHGINAVVMLVLLFTSRQPSRVLHFFHAFLFGISWAIFSVIYYAANGINKEGKRYIYPVVDWAKPLRTFGVVAATAMTLGLFHLLVVGLAALRDSLSKNSKEERGRRVVSFTLESPSYLSVEESPGASPSPSSGAPPPASIGSQTV